MGSPPVGQTTRAQIAELLGRCSGRTERAATSCRTPSSTAREVATPGDDGWARNGPEPATPCGRGDAASWADAQAGVRIGAGGDIVTVLRCAATSGGARSCPGRLSGNSAVGIDERGRHRATISASARRNTTPTAGPALAGWPSAVKITTLPRRRHRSTDRPGSPRARQRSSTSSAGRLALSGFGFGVFRCSCCSAGRPPAEPRCLRGDEACSILDSHSFWYRLDRRQGRRDRRTRPTVSAAPGRWTCARSRSPRRSRAERMVEHHLDRLAAGGRRRQPD